MPCPSRSRLATATCSVGSSTSSRTRPSSGTTPRRAPPGTRSRSPTTLRRMLATGASTSWRPSPSTTTSCSCSISRARTSIRRTSSASSVRRPSRSTSPLCSAALPLRTRASSACSTVSSTTCRARSTRLRWRATRPAARRSSPAPRTPTGLWRRSPSRSRPTRTSVSSRSLASTRVRSRRATRS